MKKYENDCCDCAAPGYPCIGSQCHRRHVPHWYCDECGEECDPKALYVTEKCEELCIDCLLSKFQTVAQFEGKG